MSSSFQFELRSRWWLAAPPDTVWQTLRTPEQWPQWWTYVRSVQTLEPGAVDGVGARHRFHWSSRLPYDVHLDIRTVACEPGVRLRGEASGDLRGIGEWRLSHDAGGTGLEYSWAVDLEKRWMRWLAPLLKPLFAWNHRAVMAAGEAGLRRWLRS